MERINTAPTPTFKVNDRVQFYTQYSERGSAPTTSTIEYGIIEKINTITAEVRTRDGKWKLRRGEMTHYTDPFIGWVDEEPSK